MSRNTDITKCANGCKIRLLCHRWTNPAHPTRQSYADFKPDPVTGRCEEFWENDVSLESVGA